MFCIYKLGEKAVEFQENITGTNFFWEWHEWLLLKRRNSLSLFSSARCPCGSLAQKNLITKIFLPVWYDLYLSRVPSRCILRTKIFFLSSGWSGFAGVELFVSKSWARCKEDLGPRTQMPLWWFCVRKKLLLGSTRARRYSRISERKLLCWFRVMMDIWVSADASAIILGTKTQIILSVISNTTGMVA